MLNEKGYTIVEGIIAMLLVAIMVGGIFSSLMASRRAIIEPSLKEEMIYSMETVANKLKNAVDTDSDITVCGNDTPLNCDSTTGCDCSSELPPGCVGIEGYPNGDKYFVYFVRNRPVGDFTGKFSTAVNEIIIKMKCNGETL